MVTGEKGTEPQTPTPEEQMEALKTEKAELEQQLEQTKKGLSTAHQRITEKDVELKKRTDLESRIDQLSDEVKFFTSFYAENQGKSTEEFDEAKTTRPEDLLKKFQAMKTESETKRKQEAQRQEYIGKIQSYQQRVEGLGLTETDDEYLEIQDIVTRGNFPLAERRIAKLEKSKEPEKPKETEAEMKERIKREVLEERGELTPEGGTPSAPSGLTGITPAEIERHRKEPDFFKWFKENEAEIDKLYSEGKIK